MSREPRNARIDAAVTWENSLCRWKESVWPYRGCIGQKGHEERGIPHRDLSGPIETEGETDGERAND